MYQLAVGSKREKMCLFLFSFWLFSFNIYIAAGVLSESWSKNLIWSVASGMSYVHSKFFFMQILPQTYRHRENISEKS